MAPKKNLSNYYNEKYSEHDVHSPPDIVRKRFPQNRFEAMIKWVIGGKRLLEVGAGTGGIIKALRPRFEECIATDIAESRVTALQNYFTHDDGVSILRHDIDSDALPFSNGYFDTVLLVDVIEHVINPIAVLQEINRVLVRGGKLYIHTPNIAKWTRRLKLVCGCFPSTASRDEGLKQYGSDEATQRYDEGHLHYFTFRSLSRIVIGRAHFTSVVRHGYGPLAFFCELWPTMLSDIVLIAIK